jgi:excisionase family DNA binding protein
VPSLRAYVSISDAAEYLGVTTRTIRQMIADSRLTGYRSGGKPIRRVLEWLVNRDLTDAEMAKALGIPPANYSRRKDQDDFPNFEELTRFGEHFGVNPLVLQISFGFLPRDGVVLLDEAGMAQYVQLGVGDVPQLPSRRWGTRENGEKNGEKPSRIAPEESRGGPLS